MRPAQREQRGEVRQAADRGASARTTASSRQSAMIAEMRHHRRTFLDLADAFEWLVPLQPAQFGKSVDLRRIVQHVAAECRDQALPLHEWRQRQKDEAALRTIAAPVRRRGAPATGGTPCCNCGIPENTPAWRANRRAMATSDSGRSKEK